MNLHTGVAAREAAAGNDDNDGLHAGSPATTKPLGSHGRSRNPSSSVLVDASDAFTTIDWLADGDESMRETSGVLGHSSSHSSSHMDGVPSSTRGGRRKLSDGDIFTLLSGVGSYIFEASQSWLAAVAVGISCGVVASCVEVVTSWLTDLKLGFCSRNIWASEYLCCLRDPRRGATSGGNELRSCDAFVYWADWLHSSNAMVISEFFVYVAVSTSFAVLACWLCREYAPQAAGSGIIEVKTILSGIRMKEYLTGRVLAVKCISICAAVGSGLSLGKEGPFVHICCCVAAVVSKVFPKYRKDEAANRELVSAAAAAGVSVAFGAPIGGVLFSLEEVSYFFPHRTMIQALVAAVVSSLVMQRIDATHSGRAVLFSVSYKHNFHWFELSAFTLIGVLGGIVGATINRWNRAYSRLKMRSSIKLHPVREVFLLALLTAMINFVVPVMRGGMLSTLAELFDDCSHGKSNGFLCEEDETAVVLQLTGAAMLRMALTSVTVTCALPAGSFVPPLFVGACLGRAVGLWTRAMVVEYHPSSELLQASCGPDAAACVIPGVYAIVGAAAALAGVTRMTICLVVIMFELTGGLEYVVPCMLVVITSRWIGDVLGVPSIYEIGLDIKRYPYLNTKTEFALNTTVRDFLLIRRRIRKAEATPPLPPAVAANHDDPEQCIVLWDGMTLHDVDVLLQKYKYQWFPVVASLSGSVFIGSVARTALAREYNRERTAHTAARDDSAMTAIRVYFSKSRALISARTAKAPIASSLVPSNGVFDWSNVVDNCAVQASLDLPVAKLLLVFKALGNQHVVVVDGGSMVSIITRRDMVDFLRVMRTVGGARGSLRRWMGRM